MKQRHFVVSVLLLAQGVERGTNEITGGETAGKQNRSIETKVFCVIMVQYKW